MPDTPVARTALAHLERVARAGPLPAAGSAAVLLGERRPRGQFTLRGDSGDEGFVPAVRRACGLIVPTAPNTVTNAADGTRLLWLGPDEWLLAVPERAAAGVGEALRTAQAGVHMAVVDTTDARTVLLLAGPRARDVLAKGCPLDVHPRAFAVDHCAQTLLARAHVLLHRIHDLPEDAGPAFELYVHRSFADYLWHWLEDAAGEYGFAIVADTDGA